MSDSLRRDPMQEFANRIVAELENGIKPWVRPWNPEKAGGPQAPYNPVTGKRYHGINVLILGMDVRAFDSGDPRWMTYQQAQEKNWHVKKGEKSTTIFFSKPLEIEDGQAEDNRKTIRLLKHYAAFHASQIDGIPEYKPPGFEEAPWMRPEGADIILKNSGAVIRIGGDRAFYSPSTDHIQLPPAHAFHGPPEFAATALHELGHWTGHPSRLNRDMQTRFGFRRLCDGGIACRVGVGLRRIGTRHPDRHPAPCQLYRQLDQTAERRQARNLPGRCRRAEDRRHRAWISSGLCGSGSI